MIFLIAISFFIIGVIVGVNFRDEIYTKLGIVRKKYNENKKEIIACTIFLLVGILIGVLITLNLKSNSLSLLAEWISGIGTLSAVIVSLWLATGRKSRLKINHGQNFNKFGQKEIYFVAYNLSDVAMTLEFYGIKKIGDKLFKRASDLEPEVVDAGKFQKKSLDLNFIKQELKIDNNNKGNIISCFAEPDGTQHCEVINWREEMSKFEKLNQKIKADV